jgi:hypothetical protein
MSLRAERFRTHARASKIAEDSAGNFGMAHATVQTSL